MLIENMNQEDNAVEFAVVFYNGERQVYIGKIKINPTIYFQKFRTMLKQKIGVSYNNLTTYLVDNRRPETPRKILITSKVDFMVLIQERNAYFLVVLKRSRRDRRRKSYRQNYVEELPADLFDYGFDYHDELEMESGKNNIMMHDNLKDDFGSSDAIFQSETPLESRALCGDCMQANEKGVKPEFHLCVYDEVVEGCFKSPVGPICRPINVKDVYGCWCK